MKRYIVDNQHFNKMARTQTENKIQQDCVIWFNNNYCLKFHNPRYIIFSVPNEGEDAYETKRKRERGMLPGVSDLIIVGPDLTLFMETKTPEGRQANSQKDFQCRVEALGFKYYMFRSLEEFKEIIKKQIDGKN